MVIVLGGFKNTEVSENFSYIIEVFRFIILFFVKQLSL